MKGHIMLIFFIVVIISMAYAIPQEAFCCPQEYSLKTKKHSSPFCFNSKTNTSTIISLQCNLTQVIPNSAMISFIVTEAGYFKFSFNNMSEDTLDPSTFCVANRTLKNGNTINVAVICNEEDEKIIDDSILGYCSIVSVIFLVPTAIIYAALPELRDLQGKSIVNFCGSMAIGLGILVITKLMEYSDMNLCAARGFLIYFFLLATFFWMNAISIQILLSIRRPSISNYGWKEFGWYALYAWGCPALLTISMAIVNYYPGTHQRPGIGLNHCWFFNHRQQWIYMYSVMSILIAINICIFIYISTHLWRHTFSSSHITALKYKFTMTLRLFIIMGLPWIFEMISSSVKTHIIWVVLDLFNTLQGPLIFLVLVVLRRRVVKALHRRDLLCCLSGVVERYLATKEDDENNVIQHTQVIPMDDK